MSDGVDRLIDRPAGGSGALEILGWDWQRDEEPSRGGEIYNLSRAHGAARLSNRSVKVVAQGRFEEGKAMLERARAELHALRGNVDPPTYAVVERWYNTAVGFLHYRLKEFEEADAAMVRADENVVTAISHERSLLPLAIACSEHRIQRARIARNRRAWRDMHEHLAAASDMLYGRRPLCVLLDGSAIWVSQVQRFVRSLPPPKTKRAAELLRLADEAWNRPLHDRTVRRIIKLDGFVIRSP